jgi:hypothetical protein
MFVVTDIRATFDAGPTGMLYLACRSSDQATAAPQSDATLRVGLFQNRVSG